MSLSNNLRADLYTKLLPRILQEDQSQGVSSYVHFWDDPSFHWDDGSLWDEIGVVPILKQVFYAIEKEETADLVEIDGLRDLVDPNRCPEDFLDYMARSLGHPLEDGLTEAGKREVIKSVLHLNKIRGRELSWTVFFRMLGYTVFAIPLWKKDIYEENEDYERERYETADVVAEVLGTPGLTEYSGTLAQPPLVPGTLRIRASGVVYRDEGNMISSNFGELVAGDGSTGTINYATGDYTLFFTSVTTTNVEADYAHVTNEHPYRAARVDLEIFFYIDDLGEGGIPFDETVLNRLLTRLEEVRPIHVLVRLIVIVLDAPEILEDFCTDEMRCGPSMGKDVRSNEYRFYAADLGVAPHDNDILEEEDGATLDLTMLCDDHLDWCDVPDALILEFSDGRPDEYW